MGRLKVTQLRSKVGGRPEHRETLRSLGLKRIGDVVVKEDRPEIRGMVKAVRHLILVEEVYVLPQELRKIAFVKVAEKHPKVKLLVEVEKVRMRVTLFASVLKAVKCRYICVFQNSRALKIQSVWNTKQLMWQL
jgi:large subunit ribosomal protein L30